MPELDPTVSSLLDRSTTTTTTSHDPDRDSSDIDEDALLSTLESSDLSHLRERRLQQLSEELTRAKALKASGTGTYSTIHAQECAATSANPSGDANKAVLELTTSHDRAVVHFFRPDFARCGIMDGHLQRLAERHYEVKFARVDVTECPFLVERLKVRVLPCVLGFVRGVAVDRVVGFEGLRGDGFRTAELEKRFVMAGVLVRAKLEAEEDDGGVKGRGMRRKPVEDEDEGDDWD